MKLVIDSDRWLHLLRRAWWRFWCEGAVFPGRCFDCGKHLNAEEREFYTDECERCVGIGMERKLDA